jgi:hypothetical protein
MSGSLDDPVTRSRDGRSLLPKSEWQDFGWVDPDDRLEANGEEPKEHEQEGHGRASCGFAVRHLRDETRLDRVRGGHTGNSDEEELASTERVDEEPGDE